MCDKKNVIVSMLIILLLCLSQCIATGENLLANADFKELNDEGLPEEWYTDAYILDTGYSVFNISENEDNHSLTLMIQNIGENDARFAQTVSVEPGSLYLLSGYIKAEGIEGGQGANLSVEGVYAFSEKVYDTDGQWKYIEYYGETGPDQDYITVFARLGGYSGVCTGKAWYTGLSLVKVDSIPGDKTADLWYRPSEDNEENDYEQFESDQEISSPFWPGLLMISVIYASIFLIVLFCEKRKQNTVALKQDIKPAYTAFVIFLALGIRLVISWFVEGYMVDVNCFLSWGQTMASCGPVHFYEATSFCDYPPLYTYVLGLNSIVKDLLGGKAETARVVFRFIPSVCDLVGSWLLFRVLLRQNSLSKRSSFLFFAIMAFNPATILNSSAWGQMDSALCLLLLAVALFAIEGKWKTALPLYVIAVLIKPQALMLGPLGLTYIVMTFIHDSDSRKAILAGTGFSVLVLALGVIPFSIYQNWDWLISLYSRTLASYPYASVNTANIYYLLGGNWDSVNNTAHIAAPVLFGILCLVYGYWWHRKAKEKPVNRIETIISLVFALCFAVLAYVKASWAWTGGLAMAYAFVIVISTAVRSNDIRMLPWLGGLLFILLYVFGVKMHERYIFPALLLLFAAWVYIKDRRILYILLLFTLTLFVNEGIVLDNSIRLGSGLGHLNGDTVWLADLISILNILGSVYAVWVGTELLLGRGQPHLRKADPWNKNSQECDRSLHWCVKDTVFLSSITAVYALISLLTLGSTKAPQSYWTSSSANEQIVFDLGEKINDFEILYFAQVSRNDFSFSVSEDGETWEGETWAQMDQGQCWKWKYVTQSYQKEDGERTYYNSDESYIVRFSGRYVRLSSQQLGLRLNEVLFRDTQGTILEAEVLARTGSESESELYSDPANLLDEQGSMEAVPSLYNSSETAELKVQPSWWNSTYFDEIYHARTAYEFLQKSVPYETSHPPLGKLLMSASIAIFGMTPFGWRFAGAVAGVLMLPGIYLLIKQLTKKSWIAVLGCLLMSLDCMHLTQTQIATIDSFPVLFIIFAYYFMLRFLQTDFCKEKIKISLYNLAFSGLFMGFAIASKWIGIYAGVGLAVLFFWHCIRILILHKNRKLSQTDKDNPATDINHSGNEAKTKYNYGLKKVLEICCWCIVFFVIVPIVIYLLSYIPYMAYNTRRIHSLTDYLNEVWKAQIGMLNYHSTPNLGMDHPFYSPWWQWPVIGKPMYYASQQYIPDDSPVHHSIFCFGNPVIWFGGLVALFVCILRSAYNRRYKIIDNDYIWHFRSTSYDCRYAFILIGLLAQYLPWVLVPRGTYIYHYFASIPFLIAAICISFDGYGVKAERWTKLLSALFIIACAVFFILLFPYATGLNVSSSWLDIGSNILRIWY